MLSRFCFCLLFLFILNGCCQEKDLLLSPALPAWAPYAGQQELTFANPGGDTLVLVADLSHFNQSGSDKLCGSYEIETLQVNLRAKEDPSFKVQVTLSHEILVRIKLLREEPPAQGLDITFNTISELYISDAWRDKFFKEIALNGKTYRNVLHAFGRPVAGDLSISEIYYGKEVGLIGFRLFSGDAYFLL
jgi:hypothetical protein